MAKPTNPIVGQIYGPIQRSLRCLGLYVARNYNTLRTKRAEVLRSCNISLVLDVGANVGQYAQELRSCGYAGAITSFEPVSSAYKELTERAAGDSTWRCCQIAAGAADGRSDMCVSESTVNSSVLSVLDAYTRSSPMMTVVGRESVPMRRLDSVAGEILGNHRNVYLKIDTQGYELEVLKGARDLLRRLRAVEVELSLAPIYKNQPLLPEVMAHLLMSEYHPIWIERGFLHPQSGHMLQVDALFVR